MCFPLTVRSELSVEWIDANTIRVSGYGYGGGVTNDNQFGSCTNCLAISPAEMRSIKSRILGLVEDSTELVWDIQYSCDTIEAHITSERDDISTFRRFGSAPVNILGVADRNAFTSYVYSVDNIQTQLDRVNRYSGNPSQGGDTRWAGYNNGIYDYAVSYVSPMLQDFSTQVGSIRTTSEDVESKLETISTVVTDITEESCQSCGGGTGTGDCSSCPCMEQWEALLDYVRHIDEDQHKRFTQLGAISNNVFNIDEKFDSYAKLVSGVLYNDSTITLEDGETWTNVYFSGESEGYHYDKSNILQRIELILFGMAYSPTNTFEDLAYSYTNSLDDTQVENVTNRFDDFSTSISNGFDSAYKDFRAHVDSLKSIDTMFVFWGQAGSASPFVLGQVPDLGGSGAPQYIAVGNDFLGSEVPRFRMLCRYAFQLLWAVLFLFMIWEFYVRLFKYVVVFLKYVCEWLNECFAS